MVYPPSETDFRNNYLAPGYYSTDFENPPFSSGEQASSINLGGATPDFGPTSPFGLTIEVVSEVADPLWIVSGSLPSGQAMSTSPQGYGILITFTTANVSSVGANFFLSDTDGDLVDGTFSLKFNYGISGETTLSDLTAGFYGFHTEPGVFLTSLTLTPNAEYMTFDNLNLGAVPEPSTWFAIGFVGLAAVGRYGRSLYARVAGRN
ncbi:MAG TPA: PEP-CTERM sorting domain-containing protein [Verrucomicrobiae bacterium]